MSTNPIARDNDKCKGTCNCHLVSINTTGNIVECSDDYFVNARGVARLGDEVVSECSHTGNITTSAKTFFVNNIPVARNTAGGEKVESGCLDMIIIEGSDDFFVE